MALALSRHVEQADSSAASSQTVTLPGATASGDGAVLFISTDSTWVSGVSGLGATWKKAIGPIPLQDSGFGKFGSVECWIGTGCTAGNTVVTVTFGVAASAMFALSTWTGGLTGVVDTAFVQGPMADSADVDMGATNSPASSGYVVVGFGTWHGSTAISSSTDSPGAFTLIGTLADGTISRSVTHSYRIAAETGTEQRVAHLAASTAWSGLSVILTSGSDKLQQPRVESWGVNSAGGTLTVRQLNAGDAIVLFHQAQSVSGASSVSGCGATWTLLRGPTLKPVLNDWGEIWLGTGCSAGDGTITVTENGGTNPAMLAVVVNTGNQTIYNQAALNGAGDPGLTTAINTGPVQAQAVLDPVITFFVSGGGAIPALTGNPGAFTIVNDTNHDGTTLPGGEPWQVNYRIAAEAATDEYLSGTNGANKYSLAGSVVLSLTAWPVPPAPPRLTVAPQRAVIARASGW